MKRDQFFRQWGCIQRMSNDLNRRNPRIGFIGCSQTADPSMAESVNSLPLQMYACNPAAPSEGYPSYFQRMHR